MKWQLKYVKNAVFSVIPKQLQEHARWIKRKILPNEYCLTRFTLEQGIHQVQMLNLSGHNITNKDCLELGTGWVPIIPLVFYLAGCKSLTLIDSQRLIDERAFRETCLQLAAVSAIISSGIKVDQDEIEAKLFKLAELPIELAFSHMNCRYFSPYDLLTASTISDNTFDIIISRAVLEHIHKNDIMKFFYKFYKLLKNKGVMCHIIDNSDHWEHGDKSITKINFLRFSDKKFKMISSMNPLDYQNRLRHSQYIKLMRDSGFELILDDSRPDEKVLSELKSLKIDKSFSEFSKDDLAIMTSYLVAVKTHDHTCQN